jgi:hypothetical protein
MEDECRGFCLAGRRARVLDVALQGVELRLQAREFVQLGDL